VTNGPNGRPVIRFENNQCNAFTRMDLDFPSKEVTIFAALKANTRQRKQHLLYRDGGSPPNIFANEENEWEFNTIRDTRNFRLNYKVSKDEELGGSSGGKLGKWQVMTAVSGCRVSSVYNNTRSPGSMLYNNGNLMGLSRKAPEMYSKEQSFLFSKNGGSECFSGDVGEGKHQQKRYI
jgi:hypothetical protein